MTTSLFPTFGRLFSWKAARVMLISAATVATAIGLFYAVENWRGQRAWENYASQSHSKGVVLDLTVLIPPPLPPGQNFALIPFLSGLRYSETGQLALRSEPNASMSREEWNQFLSRISNAYRPKKGNWMEGTRADLVDWAKSLEEGPRLRKTAADKPSTVDVPATEAAQKLLAAMDPLQPTLQEIQSAMATRSDARFPVNYQDGYAALLPHLSALKGLSQAFGYRALFELGLGETQKAEADAKAALALADTLKTEPILISQLVRFASFYIGLHPFWEGLVRHLWTDPELRYFQDQFHRFDATVSLRPSLAMERVAANKVIDEIQHDRKLWTRIEGGDASLMEHPRRTLTLYLWPSGWFKLEKLHYSQLLDELALLIPATGKIQIDPEQVRQANARIEDQIRKRSLWDHREFAAVLLPALGKAFEKVAQAADMARAAEIACALERFRLAQGAYPSTLEQLRPSFLAELPADVIRGETFRYRLSNPDRYLLYSVGWNKQDDGGTTARSVNDQLDLDWVWPVPKS